MSILNENLIMDLELSLKHTREEQGISLEKIARIFKDVFEEEEIKAFIKQLEK